jgi:hypothetical protein
VRTETVNVYANVLAKAMAIIRVAYVLLNMFVAWLAQLALVVIVAVAVYGIVRFLTWMLA